MKYALYNFLDESREIFRDPQITCLTSSGPFQTTTRLLEVGLRGHNGELAKDQANHIPSTQEIT